MIRRITITLTGLVLAACLGGCTSYYKVTDPSTRKEYYTTEIKEDHGSTVLKDGKTGSKVTIQNSEVKKITQEEYETGRVR